MSLGLQLGADVPEERLGEDAPTLERLETGRPPDRRLERPVCASALLHLAAVAALLGFASTTPGERKVAGVASPVSRPVLLLPPEVLRSLLGAAAPRPPVPPKSRVSIGRPSDHRARELVLRRDEDLTRAARGTAGTQPAPRPAVEAGAGPASPSTVRTGVAPPGRSAGPPPVPAGRLDLESALARAVGEDRARAEAAGSPDGVGPLRFDPQGADFTRWVQHFKTEVYRNWIVPPSVAWGWGGRAGFEFTVDRSGRIVSLVDLETSGTGALDRAARNALRASSLLPLPSDYAFPTVSMRVTFDYGPGRRAEARR